MGGVFAGQAIAEFLETGDEKELEHYQKNGLKDLEKNLKNNYLIEKLS